MRQKRKSKQPPWRNPNGTKKTDVEISRFGQNWDLKTWEKFLDEDVGKITDDGQLYFVRKFEGRSKLEKQVEEDGKLSNKMENLDLEVIFKLAFEELTSKERLILEKIFWNGMSFRQISKDLKCPLSSIHVAKEKSLEKLKKILTAKGFGERLSCYLKRHVTKRPKRARCESYEFLKNENLNFIEDNLSCLKHTERKVVECLYFKDMDLQTVASIIKKTPDETSKINKVAGKKLQRIFDEETARNQRPIKQAG